MPASRNSRSDGVHLGPRAPRKLPLQGRSRALVDAVIEAAARIFERDGYAATTNAVAEEAGVSIGSFYQYFPDKASLLTALHERHVEEVAERALGALEGRRGQPADVVLAAVVGAVMDLHHASPRLQRLLHVQQPQLGHVGRESEAKKAFGLAVAEWLQSITGLDRCGSVRAAWLLLAMSESLIHAAFLDPPPEVEPETLNDDIVRALGAYVESCRRAAAQS